MFFPDRRSSVAAAEILADRVRLPSATEAIEELLTHEETHAREALRRTLGSSIAFHNSDLTRDERELVERNFRQGKILAVLSTSTLAMGMNLPVKNVIIDTTRSDLLISRNLI